jgi:oligopeptide/dipeptide ABC transporter ATP-binding protein
LSIVLEVKNLKTKFTTDDGSFFAVDDVSFNVPEGKTLGIVGESGCGKSVTSLSIMRLIQKPGEIVSGEILFQGKQLLKISDDEMRTVRGNDLAMIFQEPMTSLNPVFTCGHQIEEVIALHQKDLTPDQVQKKAIEMLRLVGIPSPEKRFHEYPHQLSGGMRQRVMIAMALSCDPHLLIADEPTTALDVTIQAQILDLMRKLQKDLSAAMILITHDLGVVAEMCHEVAVMYAGKIIEFGSVEDIFYRPQHPYTQGLLKSIPHFDSGKKLERLQTIPGLVPSLLKLPPGCRFSERCQKKTAACDAQIPQLKNSACPSSSKDHQVACLHADGKTLKEIL